MIHAADDIALARGDKRLLGGGRGRSVRNGERERCVDDEREGA
jgi:hypothetical protein